VERALNHDSHQGAGAILPLFLFLLLTQFRPTAYNVLTFIFEVQKRVAANLLKPLLFMVPGAGIEPAQSHAPRDFKSVFIPFDVV
jgi:hypothetical protein